MEARFVSDDHFISFVYFLLLFELISCVFCLKNSVWIVVAAGILLAE